MNEVIERNIEDTSLNGKDSFVKRIIEYHYSKRKKEEEVTSLKRELAETKKKLAAYERFNNANGQETLELKKKDKPKSVKTYKRRPMAYKSWAGSR